MITGMMMISISKVAVTTRLPCCAAMSPAGLSTTALLQPVRLAVKAAAVSHAGPRGSLIFSMLGAQQERVYIETRITRSGRSEEHTSELQSPFKLVFRLL